MKNFREYAETLDAKSIRLFEIGASLVGVGDLWAQWYYLRSPQVPATPLSFPIFASVMGAVIFWSLFHSNHFSVQAKIRKAAVVFILICHYFSVILNSHIASAADAWLWIMAIAYLGIPTANSKDETVRSLWCFAFKTTGFIVYLFAGLHKMIHPGWWNGETLSLILTDTDLIIPPFDRLSEWPAVCMVFSWVTLFQRLIVPWGLWSKNDRVRRASILILASMHLFYLLCLRIGIFSWVGPIYLAVFWVRPKLGAVGRESVFSKSFAVLFLLYTFSFPTIYYGMGILRKPPTFLMRTQVPGFTLWWGMFADYSFPNVRPNVWEFGDTKDYFRRRLLAR